jgi:hypothetical protein
MKKVMFFRAREKYEVSDEAEDGMEKVLITKVLPATIVARRAFYALGRRTVYTNNYKECRTVKAYRTNYVELDIKIASEVTNLLKGLGYKGISVDFTKAQATYRGAIIIRIPK